MLHLVDNLPLTVLEGEGPAEHVVCLVDGEEVQEHQARLHYEGGGRRLVLA